MTSNACEHSEVKANNGESMKKSRTKRLAIWSALPPYLGGKRKLCPLIFREVDRLLPRRQWPYLVFLDAFLGGASVSLYAKAQGLKVVACDIAERSIVVGQALISNSRVKLTREDVLRLVAPSDHPPRRVERDYAPGTFTAPQARFLDRALAVAAESRETAKGALIRLLAIRVALLAHPMSQVRAGTIHRVSSGEYESITESCVHHYVDGLRLTRPEKLWELAQQINGGIFQGEAQVMRASVIEALPGIQADVAYFDPPYPGVMSYEKEYKIIDEVLEGSSRPTSPFTAKNGASMIDTVFERAQHIPVWLLSLGNAVVGIDELEAKMARLGRETKAIAVKYQHLPAVATEEKKRENREFLVVGWDPDASQLKGQSVQRTQVWQRVAERKLADADTGVEDDATAVVAQLPTSPPGPGDTHDESGAVLAQALGSGRRNTVSETEFGTDEPGAVIGHPGRNDGGERTSL